MMVAERIWGCPEVRMDTAFDPLEKMRVAS